MKDLKPYGRKLDHEEHPGAGLWAGYEHEENPGRGSEGGGAHG
ncbi:MAG: hypothetical protein QGI83_22580 [Candidatus Latescibacteria bacterium]|jgi:hypothetical protein|nr:hypothetical protein [Candidatus Latescibacterota bacterium]